MARIEKTDKSAERFELKSRGYLEEQIRVLLQEGGQSGGGQEQPNTVSYMIILPRDELVEFPEEERRISSSPAVERVVKRVGKLFRKPFSIF